MTTDNNKMKQFQLFGLSLFLCTLASFGQNNPAWEKWIQANSLGVSLSDTNDLHDLSFLKEILKNKKIVFLGENSHGVAEFTLLKSRMIRYLHDSLGFDVLAFESNSGDAYGADIHIPTANVQTSIYNSISSLWHVEEIVPLFNYIKNTHSTKNPLHVAGVDFLASNGSYSFSYFLYDLIFPVNSSYAKEVKESDSLFSRLGVRKWTIGNILGKEEKEIFKSMGDKQILFYSNLIDFINTNEDKFEQNQSENIEAAKYFLQSRIDLLYYSNRDSLYMANKLPLKDSKMNMTKLMSRFRDYMMAQQLKFLTTTLYPEKKIMVWAEDSHIAKWKYRMATDSSYYKLTYTIGFLSYSGKGSYVMAQVSKDSKPERSIYEFITPTDSLSVEKIMYGSKYENTFVDMMYQTKCEGNSWMFEKSKWTEWEGEDVSDVENIRNVFDGFILVSKISPPKYLKYDYEYLRKK